MSDMVSDVENLFYAQMDNSNNWVLMKISKKGGEPTKLAPSISEVMEFVAADGYIYYFERESGNNYLLRKISASGGEPVTLDRGADSWNHYLAVDKTQVYFTTIAKVQALEK
jgi:organic radical activating enzyme